MSVNVRPTQILLKRGNLSQSTSYTGPIGEVTIDTDLQALRIHDGITPGGHIAAGGGGNVDLTLVNTAITALRANVTAANTAIITANIAIKGYVDAQVATKASPAYVTSAIVTAINGLINSAPGTLDTLGEIAANLAQEGNAIGAITNSITSLRANAASQQTQINNLIVGAPNTGNTGFVGDAIYNFNGPVLENADLSHGATAAVMLPGNGSTNPLQINNTYGPVTIGTGASAGIDNIWQFGTDGKVSVPQNIGVDINWTSDTAGGGMGDQHYDSLRINNDHLHGLYITNTTDGTSYSWLFVKDGQLQSPQGGRIGDTYSDGHGVGLSAGPGADDYAIINSHTGAQYIEANESAVYIGTNYPVGGGNTWAFNKDGSLTFPDSTTQTTAWQIHSQTTAPTNGLWYNTSDGRLYVKYSNTWVDANPTVAPAPSYYLGNLTVDGEVVNFTNGNLTIDNTGNLLVNGNLVTGSGGSTYGNVNVAQYLNHLDTAITWTDGTQILVDSGIYLSSSSATGIAAGEASWVFHNDSTVSWPNSLTIGTSGGPALWTTPNSTTIAANNGITLDTQSGDYNWVFDISGGLTLPGGAKITGAGYKFATDNTVTTNLDLRDSSQRGFFTDASGFTLRSNNHNWVFDGSGILNLPNSSTGSPLIQGTNSIQINADGDFFTFGADGNITLPTNTSAVNYANGQSILSGISGTANTGDITFSGSNITGIGTEVEIIAGSSTTWTFDPAGALTIPGTIITQYGNISTGILGPGLSLNANVDAGQEFLAMFIGNTSNPYQSSILADQSQIAFAVTNAATNQSQTWTLDNTGNLILPQTNMTASPQPTSYPGIVFTDGTKQITAAQRKVNPPTTSAGQQGDTAGQYAVDNNFYYYCTTNWVDQHYSATSNTRYTSDGVWHINKGSYPQPQVGWTITGTTYPYTSGFTTTITSVTDEGATWGITGAGIGNNGVIDSQPVVFFNTSPYPAIWKTIPITLFGNLAYSDANVTAYLAGNVNIGTSVNNIHLIKGNVVLGPNVTAASGDSILTVNGGVSAPVLDPNTVHMQGRDSNALGITLDTNSNTAAQGTSIRARRARNTSGLPLAVQKDDRLLHVGARGYGSTGYLPSLAYASTVGIDMHAAENHTDTAQGTYMELYTTPLGSNVGTPAVTLLSNSTMVANTIVMSGGIFWANGTTYSSGTSNYGNVDVGAYLYNTDLVSNANINVGQTTSVHHIAGNLVIGPYDVDHASGDSAFTINLAQEVPKPSNAVVHVSGANNKSISMTIDSYGTNVASTYVSRRARGTTASPSAILSGDPIGAYIGRGYGATGFYTAGNIGNSPGFSIYATETHTDTAQGTFLSLKTTANGSVLATEAVRVNGNGSIIVSGAVMSDNHQFANGVNILTSLSTLTNGTKTVTLANTGVITLPATTNNVTFDAVNANVISLATNGTITFTATSGEILVNDLYDGWVYKYLVGGGRVSLLGTSNPAYTGNAMAAATITVSSYASMAYTGSYVFTNLAATRNYNFVVIKTRNSS